MSIEDKQAKLKELRKIQFPSDQEVQEMEQLEEELNMIHQEETQVFKETSIDLGTGEGTMIPIKIKKRKRSLLEIILEKVKSKPATFEEIQQLKLDKQKAELKRDIAKANYERKNPGGKSKRSKSSTKSHDIEREFRSKPQDFRDMLGKNDKNKYKDLTG